jgi:hypothetical protein
MTAVDYYRTDSEYSCIPESQEYIAVENRGRHGGVHLNLRPTVKQYVSNLAAITFISMNDVHAHQS